MNKGLLMLGIIASISLSNTVHHPECSDSSTHEFKHHGTNVEECSDENHIEKLNWEEREQLEDENDDGEEARSEGEDDGN